MSGTCCGGSRKFDSLSNQILGRWRETAAIVACISCEVPAALAPVHPLIRLSMAYLAIVLLGRTHLPWLRGFRGAAVLKRVIRLGPYIIGSPLSTMRLGWPWLGVAGAVLAVVPAFAAELPTLRLMLSAQIIRVLPVQGWEEAAREAWSTALGGAAQEWFYRGAALTVLTTVVGAGWAVGLSAAAFVLEHRLHLGARIRWDRHDYVVHGYLGTVFGALTAVTGSVLPAIVGHTLYNFPQLIQLARRIVGNRPGKVRCVDAAA